MPQNYAQNYTQSIEFLLILLKTDIENIDSLTSSHEEKVNKLPTYISILCTIEQMRWWFVWSPARPEQKLLDQNHLYDINNQATKLVNDFILKLASEWNREHILSVINNQNKRVELLLK